jgi:gamma-polyglutamate biosynthesis protein CapA
MKIAFLGDIALFGKYSVEKNPNIYEYFSEIKKKLKNYDYIVANLETPFTTKENSLVSKAIHLKSEVENVKILKYLGVNAVSLANNHIYDYGYRGLEETMKILNDNDIEYFGVDRGKLFLNNNNNKIAISGFCCYSTNSTGYQSFFYPKGINVLSNKNLIKTLESDKNEGYLSILSIHWGDENIHLPRYEYIELSRLLSEKYKFIIHGHHPHVMQGIEQKNESLIAYSLGNFCFDNVRSKGIQSIKVDQNIENRRSFILEVEIENNKIIKYKTLPLFSGEDMMHVDNDSKTLNNLKKYSSNLLISKEEYLISRNKKLSVLNSTKSKRTYKWYLDRINYFYIVAFIKGILNSFRYRKLLNK